jgi:hypothetical protein
MRDLGRNIPVVKLHCDLPLIGEVSRKPSQGRDQSEMGKRKGLETLFSCHFLQAVGFELGTTTVHFLAVIAAQQRHCFHLSIEF